MHSTIITIALAFFSFPIFAQNQLYKIAYHVGSEVTNKSPENIDSLQHITGIVDRPLIAWVNADYSRVRSTLSTEVIQVSNKSSQASYLLYPDLEAYEITPYDSINAEQGKTIHLIDSIKVIAGYTTQLARVEQPQVDPDSAVSMDFWYTAEIPPLDWHEYPFFKDLPGAVLAFSDQHQYTEAEGVEEIDFDEQLFEIPTNYNLQDYTISSESEQESQDNVALGNNLFTYEDSESHLLGLKDGQGKKLSDAKYAYISEFTSNKTTVTNSEGLYGLIDTEGKELIPCKWAYLGLGEDSPFVLFYDLNKAGFMDFHGQVIIPATYDFLLPFKHSYAAFAIQDKYGLLNEKGDIAVSAQYETIVDQSASHAIVMSENLYYLVDIAQNKIVSAPFSYLAFAHEGEILLAEKDALFGYIDVHGKIIIPFKFSSATPFYHGIATVVLAEGEEMRQINTKGDYIQAAAETE